MMRKAPVSFGGIVLIGCIVAASLSAAPTTGPAKIQWSGLDVQGRVTQFPTPGHPTVIALLRTGQTLSVDAIADIRRATATDAAVQCIGVFSGDGAAESLKKFVAEQKVAWPVILDRDYALAGKLSVNAWPTTIVIGGDGTQLAHLAGLSPNFSADLSAYLEFASGKIDQPTLTQKLASAQTVGETPKQQIVRLVSLANTLLERGDTAGAQMQVEKGLKMDANDAELKIALARVQLQANQPEEVLKSLAHADGQSPAWQLGLIRGQAFIALNRWNDARAALLSAIELNPHPASAFYHLGVVYRHDNDLAHAADAFQNAYEATQREVHPR